MFTPDLPVADVNGGCAVMDVREKGSIKIAMSVRPTQRGVAVLSGTRRARRVPGRGPRHGRCAVAVLQHLRASVPWPIAPICMTVYN